MPLILLDQNAPLGLRTIQGFDIRSAYSMGWAKLANGQLIAAAEEAGFNAMITADANIRYQQNLTNRRLALVVLDTNDWFAIRANLGAVEAALALIQPGVYIPVAFERRPLRRRVFNRSTDQL
jgi:hypothetical protein